MIAIDPSTKYYAYRPTSIGSAEINRGNMTEQRELNSEPEPDTRTVQELVDGGYVGFIQGSDGFAIVDPILPERPEEWDELRWRFDF